MGSNFERLNKEPSGLADRCLSSFDDKKNEIDEFEFNQDLDSEDTVRSPGWLRYQKRIK